jgi:hypothetical protein
MRHLHSLLQLLELKNHSSDKGLRLSLEETLHLDSDWSKFMNRCLKKPPNCFDLNGKTPSTNPRQALLHDR